MKPGDLVSVHLRPERKWVRVPCSADGWETHGYLDLKVGDKGVVVNRMGSQYEVLFAGHVCLMWGSQVKVIE